MHFIKVKKIISLSAVLMFTGICGIFFSPLEASALPIRVLDLSTSSTHTAAYANIDGDFLNTRVTTLVGVDFSDYDVLYVGGHDGFNPFDGREAEIAAAISAGTLGFIAANDSTWSKITNILGETVTDISGVGPNSLTAAGLANPIFSGVTFSDLDAEDAFSAIPSLATVLVEDSASNAVMFTGMLGLGRYFVTGTELVENENDTADNLLAHNAIHFVAGSAAVPEPATLVLFISGMAALFYSARRRQQMMV